MGESENFAILIMIILDQLFWFWESFERTPIRLLFGSTLRRVTEGWKKGKRALRMSMSPIWVGFLKIQVRI